MLLNQFFNYYSENRNFYSSALSFCRNNPAVKLSCVLLNKTGGIFFIYNSYFNSVSIVSLNSAPFSRYFVISYYAFYSLINTEKLINHRDKQKSLFFS